MSVSRIDLDGLGSPLAIAARIHQLENNLEPDFAIEDLCRSLDIFAIEETETSAFEAALIMDEHKASGSILLAKGQRLSRRRFSIGHELGHFLIPTHMPRADDNFCCSLADLHHVGSHEQDRRKRIESEANRFAAALLMPQARVRAQMTAREPDLGEIVRLAAIFGVSKEAMARRYVEAHRGCIAVIILQDSKLRRVYRQTDRFPWIEPGIGQPVPIDSIASDHGLQPRVCSASEECDPEVWLGERGAARVEVLTEQVLGQQQGYAMVLLHAEMGDG